jgi:UPF0148 protein
VPEEGINKAVEALFSGAKMLPLHCAECRGPLFEKEGKVFCPACGEKGAGEGKAPEAGLGKTLRKKLGELRARLEKEEDHEEMMRILKEIDALVEVLRKLETRSSGPGGQ